MPSEDGRIIQIVGVADGLATVDTVGTGDDTLDDPDCTGGSVIECQNQILGEAVTLTGTAVTLNYRSDRAPGRRSAYSLAIPLSGSSVVASLRRIDLVIDVAGQQFSQSFPGAPNQHTTFTWNGRDA